MVEALFGPGPGGAAPSQLPNGRALGGYYAVNLSALQRLDPGVLGGRGTELRLDVINLLDREYGLRRAILARVTQRFWVTQRF